MAVGVCVGWLPFVARGLSPDEAGFLIVGSQWSEGVSLYGDYWVDRPPVLILLFGLADALGGTVPLRLLGALAAVLTVVLAGVLGRLAAPERRSAPLLTAGTAAAGVATPLFGGTVVNGELLALPFLLAGLAAYVASVTTRSTTKALVLGLAAGASAATAALVKQSQVDVFVVVLVVLLGSRTARTRLPAFLLGALVLTSALVALASARGTAPQELWNAVVTFRFDAFRELSGDSGRAPSRLVGLLGCLALSGLPLVVAAFVWKGRGEQSAQGPWTAPDLRIAAQVLLAFELLVALLGGSYWLHYLMGLVPGAVLVAAAFAQRAAPVTRSIGISLAAAGLSTLIAIGWVGVHPIDRSEEPAIAYLDDHADDGDTAIVVLGAANVLREADLVSDYPYLWSLPARIRDGDLLTLAGELRSPTPPEWVLVIHFSMDTWRLDFSRVQEELDAGYEKVTKAGKFTIYHRLGA